MFDGSTETAAADLRCRACKTRKGGCRRGLCSRCYADPATRAAFRQAEAPAPKVCRHCKKVGVNRPRGLCWSCYYAPGVKALYPPTSKYAQRGVGNFTGVQPLPAEATDAEPGSAEKLAILIARAARGEQLFHPRDLRRPTRAAGVPGVVILAARPRRKAAGGERHSIPRAS